MLDARRLWSDSDLVYEFRADGAGAARARLHDHSTLVAVSGMRCVPTFDVPISIYLSGAHAPELVRRS